MSSITDWIQAIGSVIAAIGLLFALYYQRIATNAQVAATIDQKIAIEQQSAVNKAQLFTAELESKRYLREIRPSFKFKTIFDEFAMNGHLNMTVLDNPVKDFYFKVDDNSHYNILPYNNHLSLNPDFPVDFNFYLKDNASRPVNVKPFFIMELFYKDIDDNGYYQLVHYDREADDFILDIPQLIPTSI